MIKDEVRVLVVDYIDDGLIIYVIQRGTKGIEHLGVVKGGLEELRDHLRSNNLIDEVRYVVLSEFNVLKVVGREWIKIHDLNVEESLILNNIVAEGRHIIRLIKDELKLIMIQK